MSSALAVVLVVAVMASAGFAIGLWFGRRRIRRASRAGTEARAEREGR